MATDAFVGDVLSKLSALLEEKASMVPGVRDELYKLFKKLERLKIFLVDAESKAIRDRSIRLWLGELKDIVYDVDDVIDICRIEETKLLERDEPSTSTHLVRSRFPLMSCFCATKFRYDIAEQIKMLNERLKAIEENKPTTLEVTTIVRSHSINHRENRETYQAMVESEYVGAVSIEATEKLVGYLIEESEHKTKCYVLGIVGMGGIGKTTRARQIFNHPSIVGHFSTRIWLCISQTFSETDILKQIIRGAGGVCGEATSRSELCSILFPLLSGNLLIVLDDVWSADVWEGSLRSPLEKCGAQVSVLVTTRDVAIARNMRAAIHHVELMNAHDGWTLLCKAVFGDDGDEEEMRNLKDIGIQIVVKCGGLPLAIKAIAGVLRSKGLTRKDWQRLLHSRTWSMDQLPNKLRGALYLSYDDLPSNLKQCFLYFTLYFEDSIIDSVDLVRYWVAEGYIPEDTEDAIMEDTAKGYYDELIRRNLLQRDPKYLDNSRCTMHHLLRSLGQFLVREENICCDNDVAARRLLNASSLRGVRRLSLQNTTDTTTLISDIIRENTIRLRTLISHGILPSSILTMFGSKDLLKFYPCLRVLGLSHSGIKNLSDSIGKLIHLRHLDLSCTDIITLPDSIGNLMNLQTLCLQQCKNLQYLPKGIIKLCKLRCLAVDDTPLTHLPKGLDQLKQLNHLKGFFVANEGSSGESCKMEELQPLSQLRVLGIDKLERVNSGTSILTSKYFLRELNMSFSLASEIGSQYGEMEIKRIEKVMEELFPSRNLQLLRILHYPGYRFPSWMSLYTCFPHLELVELVNCTTCTHLPLLGKLPQLKRLLVKGADSVVTVGPELLFAGHAQTGEGAFPRLEHLQFMNMDNLEKWSLGDDDIINNGKLLPCLKRLEIFNCPKLRSLPTGLRHATKLEKLYISNARCIQEVKNLPFLSKVLKVVRCPWLQEIHHLPLVQVLIIGECPQLTHVADLKSLHNLGLSLYPTAERLPDWLSMLSLELHQRTLRPDFQIDLCLQWNLILLQRSRKGGEDWPIIKRFPQVNIHCRGESLCYTNAET